MESSILEIASRIATPLSLAGFVVGVLYLIYRFLLQKKLFTKVGKSQTFKIINRVILYVFILALVALLLGIGSHIVGIMFSSHTDDSEFYTLVVKTGNLPPGANIDVLDSEGKLIASTVTGMGRDVYLRIPISYRNKEIEVRLIIPGFQVKIIKILLGEEFRIEIKF